MAYQIKPLSCDPAKIKGMSERLIVSHYENNYGGAVKRLNLIEEQLAELDYAMASGSKASLVRTCATRSCAISGRSSAGGRNLWRWGRHSAAAPDGCCCRG